MEQGKTGQPDAGDWFAKSDAGVGQLPPWWPLQCEACHSSWKQIVLVNGSYFECKNCHHEWLTKELKSMLSEQETISAEMAMAGKKYDDRTEFCQKCLIRVITNFGECKEFGPTCPQGQWKRDNEKMAKDTPVAGTATDLVNHPPHYTSHPSGVECITVTEHMGFNLGNAVKYIWRADEKGAAVQDLEKAVWYVNREIAKRKKEQGK